MKSSLKIRYCSAIGSETEYFTGNEEKPQRNIAAAEGSGLECQWRPDDFCLILWILLIIVIVLS